MAISYEWRGEFTSALHVECFGHPVLDDDWDWRGQVEGHSPGWVCARGGRAGRVREHGLRGFYFDACGFTPTNAGLMEL